MINNLQILTGKTNTSFYQNNSNYYYEMNYERRRDTFQFEEDPNFRNAQSNSKIYHEVFLMKILQTTLQVKSMKIKYYGLKYTVIITEMKNK